MADKKRKNLSLEVDTINKIKALSTDENKSESAMVDKAIERYFMGRDEEHNVLVETLSKIFDEKLKILIEDLKRVKVTGNVIDRDTKMMMEFWNHYFVANEFNMFITTEQHKTKEFSEAESLIKKRISENRQRKLDWEEKRKKN